jgi:hypothetical protein
LRRKQKEQLSLEIGAIAEREHDHRGDVDLQQTRVEEEPETDELKELDYRKQCDQKNH